jgi:integrase
MGDMRPDKGVFKRAGSNVWQHRVHIPVELRAHYSGKSALPAKSLGTRDLKEANRLARIRQAKFEEEFESKRASHTGPGSPAITTPTLPPLSSGAIERLVAEYHQQVVADDFAERVDTLNRAKSDPDAFWAGKIIAPPKDRMKFRGKPTSYWDDLRLDPETPLEIGVAYALHWHRLERLTAAKGALKIGDLSEVGTLVDRTLAGSPACAASRLALCRRLLEARIGALGAIIADEPTQLLNLRALEPNNPNDAEDPLLSVAVPAWLEEKRAVELTDRRIEDCEAAVDLLLEVIGDKPLSKYTKGDVRRFKEVLRSLPPNRNKVAVTRNLGAVAAAQKAKDLGLESLAVKTINNKYLGSLFNLFEHAIGHYDEVNRNPFANSNLPVRSSPREQWDPFSTEALQKFFSAPLYTGCKSASQWLKPGPAVPRESVRFWLPLLLLYSGCRVNEICKLRISDVGHESGVRFINIEWEDDDEAAGIAGRVKNVSSERRVPIHPDLVDFGFLEFVSKARGCTSGRLFPELRPNRYGKLYSTVSQRFSDSFLPGLGLKTSKTSLKSFRHNFVDAARNSRIPDPIIQALKGDTFEGTLARYGHGRTDLEILDAEMQKLNFKGLSLDHLRIAGKPNV